MVEIVTPKSVPSVRGAGRVAPRASGALARAAGAAQVAADSFSDFYEKEAAIENDLILATTQSDWEREFGERRKQAGAGFTKSLIGDYDEYVAEALSKAPARGRDNLDLALKKYRIRLEGKALGVEAAAKAAAKARMVAEARRLKANALISDPSLLDDYLEGASAEDRGLFVRSALSGLNAIDPASVNEQVKSGRWDAVLTPQQKLSFLSSSQRLVDQQARKSEAEEAAGRRAFEENVLAEEIAYVEQTGSLPENSMLDNEVIDGASGGNREWAAEVKRRRDVAVRDAKIVAEIASASPAETAEIVERYRKAVDEPGRTEEDVARLNTVISAVNRRNKALTSDPAGFLMDRDPVLGSMLDLVAVAEPENKQEVAANAARYMDASYDRLGVPPGARMYIPKATAREMVASLAQVGDDVAPQALAEITETWGEKAPAVIEQLRREGLPSEFVVAMRHDDNPGLSTEIASLRGIKTADLKEGLPKETILEIDEASAAKLRDFTMAMEAGGGPEAVDMMNEQLDVLRRAALRRARGSKASGSEIVDDLYSQMFPETVVIGSDRAVIVPEDVDADGFERLLDEKKRTLDGIRALDIPGLPDGADMELAKTALRSLGVWVPNETGDGAVLTYDVGGRRLVVFRDDGTPYEALFSEQFPLGFWGRKLEKGRKKMGLE